MILHEADDQTDSAIDARLALGAHQVFTERGGLGARYERVRTCGGSPRKKRVGNEREDGGAGGAGSPEYASTRAGRTKRLLRAGPDRKRSISLWELLA